MAESGRLSPTDAVKAGADGQWVQANSIRGLTFGPALPNPIPDWQASQPSLEAETPSQRTTPPQRRTVLPWAIASVSLLALAGVLTWVFWGEGRVPGWIAVEGKAAPWHQPADTPPGAGRAPGRPVVKEKAAPATPLAPGPLWVVEGGTVNTRSDDGQEVSGGYSRELYTSSFYLKPRSGMRFAVVRINLTALAPDPVAVDKLLAARNYGAQHWGPLRAKLKGRYRFFDLSIGAVIAPSGDSYLLFWPIDPGGRIASNFALVGSGGFSRGFEDPAPPWHETHLTNVGSVNPVFNGLLEVESPADVAFLVTVPSSVPLQGLKFQMETDPTVPLAFAPGDSGSARRLKTNSR
jgi:hypothetical protein